MTFCVNGSKPGLILHDIYYVTLGLSSLTSVQKDRLIVYKSICTSAGVSKFNSCCASSIDNPEPTGSHFAQLASKSEPR